MTGDGDKVEFNEFEKPDGKNSEFEMPDGEARALRHKRRKIKSIMSWIEIFAVLLVLCGIGRCVFYYANVMRSNRLYSEVRGNIVTTPYADEEAVKEKEPPKEMVSSIIVWDQEEDDDKVEKEPFVVKDYTFRYTGDWQEQVMVDLPTIASKYPDVKGWLFFENDDISYPIMYSGEDELYLRTTFDGKYAKAGSIFLEGANSVDFSDSHTILYGHNMRNRSMFGGLKDYYIQPNYYDYHEYFQIITFDANGNVVKNRYKVFAYYKTPYYSDVYTIIREECDEMTALVQGMQAASLRDCDTYVTAADKVVTLSTCSSGENRFTVHAVLVDSCVQ